MENHISPSKCTNLPSHLSVNGMTSSDPTKISNLFNEHFANITSLAQLDDLLESQNWNDLTNFVHSKLPARSHLFFSFCQSQRILFSLVFLDCLQTRLLALMDQWLFPQNSCIGYLFVTYLYFQFESFVWYFSRHGKLLKSLPYIWKAPF